MFARWLLGLLLVLALTAPAYAQDDPNAPPADESAVVTDPAPPAPAHAGPDSLYPNASLTPGAVFPDVTTDHVCTPGYATSVRSVSTTEKRAIYAAYGIPDTAGADEVDHFISLELGGSNDPANLWPEPYAPKPGAHEKDRVENYLHAQVCDGAMSLQDAQTAISGDWYMVYLQLPGAVVAGPDPTDLADDGSTSDATAPAPAVAPGHTYYASTFGSADTIYCDTDPGWKSLSTRYLASYPSLDAALAALPGYSLHRPC